MVSVGESASFSSVYQGARAMFIVGTGQTVPYDNPAPWGAEPRDFFAKLQEFDPVKRPEASQLLQHPYLRTACSQADIKKMLIGVFRGQAMAMCTSSFACLRLSSFFSRYLQSK
jgi:hypothetical protein